MNIQYLAPDALKPYPGNPRRIPQSAIDAVATSIAQYGFRQPIVIDADAVVIVGHTRLAAAQQLGLASVPVHMASLTPDQARAYRLADNRTGECAGWDTDALSAELSALATALNADLAALSERSAFDATELDRLLGRSSSPTDPDEVPEPLAAPIPKRGDLWRLGPHRLMCGDSTHAEDVGRLLGGAVPNLMVTDPPYGVAYEPAWRNRVLRSDGSPTDGRAIGRPKNDDRVDWCAAWALFPGAQAERL